MEARNVGDVAATIARQSDITKGDLCGDHADPRACDSQEIRGDSLSAVLPHNAAHDHRIFMMRAYSRGEADSASKTLSDLPSVTRSKKLAGSGKVVFMDSRQIGDGCYGGRAGGIKEHCCDQHHGCGHPCCPEPPGDTNHASVHIPPTFALITGWRLCRSQGRADAIGEGAPGRYDGKR